MRVTQVRGLPVVDSRVARQAGIVSQVVIDLASARVVAVEVQHGDGWLRERLPAAFVNRLGPYAVVVAHSRELELSPPLTAEELWIDADDLVGLEVFTERGDRVGYLADAHVDPKTLRVVAYQLQGSFWGRLAGRRRRVLPEDVVVSSREILIVRDPHGPPVRSTVMHPSNAQVPGGS